ITPCDQAFGPASFRRRVSGLPTRCPRWGSELVFDREGAGHVRRGTREVRRDRALKSKGLELHVLSGIDLVGGAAAILDINVATESGGEGEGSDVSPLLLDQLGMDVGLEWTAGGLRGKGDAGVVEEVGVTEARFQVQIGKVRELQFDLMLGRTRLGRRLG